MLAMVILFRDTEYLVLVENHRELGSSANELSAEGLLVPHFMLRSSRSDLN